MVGKIIDKLLHNCPDNLESLRDLMHEHVHLRIGNRAPVLGLEAAMCELEAFFSQVSSIGRTYCEVWHLRRAALVETELYWAHLLSPSECVPCVLIVRIGERRSILDLRMYLDFSAGEPRPEVHWPARH